MSEEHPTNDPNTPGEQDAPTADDAAPTAPSPDGDAETTDSTDASTIDVRAALEGDGLWTNDHAISALADKPDGWEADVHAALQNSSNAVNQMMDVASALREENKELRVETTAQRLTIEELTSDVQGEDGYDEDTAAEPEEGTMGAVQIHVDLPATDPTMRVLLNRLQIIGAEYIEHFEVLRLLNGADVEHEDGTVGPPRLWEPVDSLAKQAAVEGGAQTRPNGVAVTEVLLAGGGSRPVSLRFREVTELHAWANNGYEVGDLFDYDHDNRWYTLAAE